MDLPCYSCNVVFMWKYLLTAQKNKLKLNCTEAVILGCQVQLNNSQYIIEK